MKMLRKTNENPLEISLSGEAKKMPVVDTSGRFKTKNKKHNAKIIKKWNIEDFQMSLLYVQVKWHVMPMGQTQQLDVCRPCFEQWLGDNGKLDWYMEGNVGEGSMEYLSGMMALDDYWENAEYDVKRKDLADYITEEQLLRSIK